jgi:glycosyltransferase involved in cell wall biosynthesis
METPKVSVIMPAYNHEKFVGEAIESVLNQTCTDFEFIIINDGSTDGTDSVIRAYNDTRIRYLNQDNQGAHNTINKGISIAKGDYISIINSDDLYHPDRLSFLVGKAQSQNAVFAFTDLIFINESGKQIKDEHWLMNLKSKYSECCSLEETFLSGNIAVTTSNFFFLSRILKEIGSFRPYRYVHDYDFAVRALLRYPENFLYISDKKFLSYRRHGTNTIEESFTEVHIEILKLLLKMTPEFMQNKNDRARVESALNYIERINESLFPELRQRDIRILHFLYTMHWKIKVLVGGLYEEYLKRKD